MKYPSRALFVAAVALAVVAAPAQAAGSKTKTEQRPGVAEYNTGVALMKKGQYAEAQKKFEAALAEDEAFAEAHNNLGYSLRKQGVEYRAKAFEHYDRAIELNPKLAEAYMYRGVLYALMGKEDKALADHATLVELNRKLARALQEAIASGEEPDGLDGLAKTW